MNRNALKAALAITLLAVSGVLLWRFYQRGAADDAPKDQFVPFHCTNPACGANFQYSHREIDAIWQNPHAFKLDARTRSVLFKCPKCGQLSAERAETPDGAPPGPVPAPPH